MITQGDTAGFNVSIRTKNGNQYILSNDDVIRMVVRKKANSEVLIEKTADSNGVIQFVPVDTKTLATGIYVYDIELVSGEIVNTIIPLSYFEICQEVSK